MWKFLELIPMNFYDSFLHGVEIEYGAQLRVTLLFSPVCRGGVEQLRGREIPRSLQEACKRLHDMLAKEPVLPEGMRPRSLRRLSRVYIGWTAVYAQAEDGGMPEEGDGLDEATSFFPAGTVFKVTEDKRYHTVFTHEEALLASVISEDDASRMKDVAAFNAKLREEAWPGQQPLQYSEGLVIEHQPTGMVLTFPAPELYFRRKTLRCIGDLARQIAPLIEPTLRSKVRRFGAKGLGVVFLSYRMGHEAFAERLAKLLHARGFRPWLDRWEIYPGDSIPQKIAEALERSDAFVPMITGDFSEGKWATKELRVALTKAIEEDYLVIPILHQRGRLPALLKEIRAIDCKSDGTFITPKHFEELVTALRRTSRGVLS